MKFVIDRAKWRGGSNGPHRRGPGRTALLNEQGGQCCLGFVCEQMGVPREALRNVSTPAGLSDEVVPTELTQLLRFKIEPHMLYDPTDHHSLEEQLLVLNDDADGGVTPEKRESEITRLLAAAGHEVEFVGRYSSC